MLAAFKMIQDVRLIPMKGEKLVDPAATNPHPGGDDRPDPDKTYATNPIISKNRLKGGSTPPSGHVLHANRPSPQRQPQLSQES